MGKIYIKFIALLLMVIIVLPFFYFSNTDCLYVTHIKNTVYQPQMEFSGCLEAASYIPVSLSYPVYIQECHIAENSYVNKGQLLFTLDMEKMKDSVNSYHFTEYLDAGISLDDKMMSSVSENIYASENGYIQNLCVSDGDFIMSDKQLCTIETTDDIILKITVSQEDYSKISVGDTVEFSPVLSPKRNYSAAISDKTARIRKENILTGTKTVVDIFAELDFTDDFIVTGLEVTGTVNKNAKEIHTLPYEYINQDDKGEYITIYNSGKIEKKYIQTGIELSDSVEILDDFDNDIIFVKNNQNIKGNMILNYED